MYDNRKIQRRVQGKPHTVKDRGWYRISPQPISRTATTIERWNEAYRFLHRINYANVCAHCGSQLPPL